MIFNHQLLFLHVPKTGGMAVTKYLLDFLSCPIYYTHPDHDPILESKGVIQIRGIRHENMDEARALVRNYGLDINQFRSIIAVLRNPYDLEVSRFAYLQKRHPWDRGRNQDLALSGDFESFAIHSCDHGGAARAIQSYFLLDGQLPPNLTILHAENLDAELADVLRTLDVPTDRALLRDNESQHGHPLQYYTRDAEKAVYRRYKWVFDLGYYPRLASESLPQTIEYPINGPRVPLMGPARQIGLSAGLWHDSWVGHELYLHVRPAKPIRNVILTGMFPKKYQNSVDVTLTLNGIRTTQSFIIERDNTSFRLECECDLPAERIARIEVTPSACWCPQHEKDSADNRELSFRLSDLILVGTRESCYTKQEPQSPDDPCKVLT